MSQTSNFSQKQNIHRRGQWIDRFLQKRRDQFSPKNLELLYDYNDDMIISSISETTRYKNLTVYGKQILKFHSDKNQIDDADEYVKLLYTIRETLLSPEKRFAYDAMRHGGTV